MGEGGGEFKLLAPPPLPTREGVFLMADLRQPLCQVRKLAPHLLWRRRRKRRAQGRPILARGHGRVLLRQEARAELGLDALSSRLHFLSPGSLVGGDRTLGLLQLLGCLGLPLELILPLSFGDVPCLLECRLQLCPLLVAHLPERGKLGKLPLRYLVSLALLR